ncbi:hypothetical protein JX265_014004 [Neoarthrinium moseri]|uniref:Uncharacterized protein n=1 Tax=Neoarthrinium moseri TaxID=1658444 RepID=A0A9P9W7L8_9PEZI|nr:hypothetical protein JX265_014004 [Neoarthrinium moseri]
MYLTTDPKRASKPPHLVTEPETSSEEEKARVDDVKALALQAFRAEVTGPVLELLIKARAWQSIQLTKNQYHLLYDLAKAPPLSHAMMGVRYDWMPNPDGYGVLTVRNADSRGPAP